ncbi:DUF3344 domain-containing protein [Streptomyces sp. NPDC126933]|uniref:DUF3344 domain-containing protein n=1 Tax=unclassified Streptomyces TaxID=2593676 RepID=UPI0036575B4C
MRNSAVLTVGRGLLCALASLVLSAAAFPSSAAPHVDTKPGVKEKSRIPFAQRYHAVQRGGIVRAANSAITCRTPKGDSACASARAGAGASNNEFNMFYTDVDKDPNTYNSTRAELRVPAGARVSYARLYWGGNLRVGEQKPPRDNGRVLLAEPRGKYREVLADTVIGHRTASGADAFQASANVTRLVRASGSGMYTVAQINVAMGRSAAGAWGGWTLVVAYEKKGAPLRHLSVWDGFDMLDKNRQTVGIDFGSMRMPARAAGRLGVVAYDGDRGIAGESLTVKTNRGNGMALGNKGNPAGDVLNSSITDSGITPIKRQPAYSNTLGYDSDVFDLRGVLASGGDRLSVRFNTKRDPVWLGAFFVEAEVRN